MKAVARARRPPIGDPRSPVDAMRPEPAPTGRDLRVRAAAARAAYHSTVMPASFIALA